MKYVYIYCLLIMGSCVNHKELIIFDVNSKSGTFWERKSKVNPNKGSGLHILSDHQLREYYFNGNNRVYENYGGDIDIDTLAYKIENGIMNITPYYSWKIVSFSSDSLILLDTKNTDTITFVRSSDQKTLPIEN